MPPSGRLSPRWCSVCPTGLRVVIVARYGLDGSSPALVSSDWRPARLTGERVRRCTPKPWSGCAIRPLAGSTVSAGRHTQADYQWATRSTTLAAPAGRAPCAALTSLRRRREPRTNPLSSVCLSRFASQLALALATAPHIPDSPNGATARTTALWVVTISTTAHWECLSWWDLVVRLVDFTPLRAWLAWRLGWTSARGQVPFDRSPCSCSSVAMVHGWSRAQALRNLRDPRYADVAQRMGFQPGLWPTEAACATS